ncbi:putative cation-transporting ATPase F [Nonomuraea coxensis DSM 45129]|uniref:Cation-transporting ATPase F n=1 Tax=Nonomuraea coxensis DSM 45129 TaxID=1122611 RepID=A0ABX8U2X9_9ACTN|nr:HAD-IC family P-type ATPase [Nonomuraea coxensis]QYC42097.1 putative cation-transporting ATPase F [Nonomuraea coxensis DSM 45129]
MTQTAVSGSADTAHHTLAPHEVVLLLESDPRHGLSEEEAERRQQQYGPNMLPQTKGSGLVMRWLRQFHHPLIYILLAAGAITGLLGAWVDATVIFAVVVVNAVIGFLQESKAEAALEGLRSMIHTQARTVRGGQVRQVPSEELVPGDLVLVEAGDKVPADLRLVRLAELRADESALTGESVPVVKDETVLPHDTPVADRRNMLYSATMVTSGTGAGVVVATGTATELGEIHRLVGTAETLATPLTRKLARFSQILTVGILALAAVTFAVGTARGEPMVEMFTAAVALAVGAIPEGLPAAVTITLAIGVARMARRRAVVRRLPAVETLGSTTVVCTDKTGTLTENQMTVRAIWTPAGTVEVTGSGYTPDGELLDATGDRAAPDANTALYWTLLAGALCNDTVLTSKAQHWSLVGDPTEAAMAVVAVKTGLDPAEAASSHPRLAEIPFSSERRYMATLHRLPDGGHVVLAKGAVERVLDLCAGQMRAGGEVAPLDPAAVLAAAEELAGRGLRVLATAMARLPAQHAEPAAFEPGSLPGTLVLTGLQAMLDPPRPAAASAVQACHDAGIAVKMITGDHAATAAAIGRQIGLLPDGEPGGGKPGGRVLTGADLAALPDEEYPQAVEKATVLARVSPEQKLRLVEALQARDHVVAMTGDGVNDAPALRRADIGIAMGRGGTEVAKDAADMVLTDDDFATIEAAAEEGRGVFDNLTKFIVWTLPTNIGEGLVILVAILLGLTLPILPVQILWINMTTAVALGLMLTFEPKEAGIMRRPPRDPHRPLLTGALMFRILLVSALLLAGTWWLFEWELAAGAGEAEARTAAVNLFVAVELVYLFSCRSLTRSMWRIGPFTNRWLLAGVGVQILAQLAITYLPAMNQVFQTAPIPVGTWLRIGALAAVAAAVVALDKRLRHRIM